MVSDTFLRNLIVITISLGLLSAFTTIILYGGPVKNHEMRDGVLFVERARGLGWKEMGDSLWLMPKLITDVIVKYVMLPSVILIVVLGRGRRSSENP